MRYQRLTAVLAAWALLAAGCSLSQDAVTDSASDGTEAPSVPPTAAVSVPETEAQAAEETAPETTEAQEAEADAPYADAYRSLIESEAYLDDAEWRDVPGDFLGTYLYAMPGRETPLLIVTDGGYNDVLFYGYDEGTDSAYLCEQVRTEQVGFTFRFRPETGDIGEQYGRIAGGGEYAIRCKSLDENVWYAFPSGDFLEGEAADEATTAAFDIVDAGTLPLFGDSWETVGGDGGVPYDMLPYVEPFIIRR